MNVCGFSAMTSLLGLHRMTAFNVKAVIEMIKF